MSGNQLVSVPRLEPDGPDTFRINDWQVFGPGWHNGKLYTHSDMDSVVRNFERLSTGDKPYLIAKAKLGHDLKQRLAESMGLPNVGRIVQCRRTPHGFAITVSGIPRTTLTADGNTFDLYGAIRDGRYDGGSVELLREVPDPDDPAKKVSGPVLESVAFLGEEQPAIKGQASPGGKPEPERFSVNFCGRECQVTRIAFSEYEPMQSRDQMLAALKEQGVDVTDQSVASLTDDQLAGLLKQMGGDAFAAAMKAKFSIAPGGSGSVDDGGQTPPNDGGDMKSFMSDCKKFFSDMTGRVGALEQGMQATQKAGADAAAFSADFKVTHEGEKKRIATERIANCVSTGRLSPYLRDAKIKEALEHSNLSKDCFSEGAKSGLTPFEAYIRDLESRPADERFSETIDSHNTGGTGGNTISEFARRTLEKTPEGRRTLKLAAEAAK